jgi:hypothetical protein
LFILESNAPPTVKVTDTKPREVTIAWNKPTDPNGDILGYSVEVVNPQNASDCQEISVICCGQDNVRSKACMIVLSQ